VPIALSHPSFLRRPPLGESGDAGGDIGGVLASADSDAGEVGGERCGRAGDIVRNIAGQVQHKAAQDSSADYRLRIFTPASELPFAGHPTLGSCHAWLQAGGTPQDHEVIVQECGAGLVQIRRTVDGLAFAAPPLLRSGPVEPELIAHVADTFGIDPGDIVDSQWVDNGPGWLGVLLQSADAVLALRPGVVDLDIGVVGPHPAGFPEAFEVRAFFSVDGMTVEDPVTGSLNAALAGRLAHQHRAGHDALHGPARHRPRQARSGPRRP